MKQIKHILVVIAAFFSLYLFVGMLAPGQLSAQTKQQLLVAVTPYRPLQNLDFFFTHSVHPLMYLEQPGQTPVFLSIITLAQRAQYVQAGYQPVIVDQQAVDMNRYYLLFSRKKKGDTHTPITIAMDSSLKQQGVKLVYPLNKEMVLAKFAPGQSLGQVAARNSQ